MSPLQALNRGSSATCALKEGSAPAVGDAYLYVSFRSLPPLPPRRQYTQQYYLYVSCRLSKMLGRISSSLLR